MNREQVVSRVAVAIGTAEPKLTAEKCRTYAEVAFDAIVRAHMPKDAQRLESNGTWWAKTPNGQKMINRITVQI